MRDKHKLILALALVVVVMFELPVASLLVPVTTLTGYCQKVRIGSNYRLTLDRFRVLEFIVLGQKNSVLLIDATDSADLLCRRKGAPLVRMTIKLLPEFSGFDGAVPLTGISAVNMWELR